MRSLKLAFCINDVDGTCYILWSNFMKVLDELRLPKDLFTICLQI